MRHKRVIIIACGLLAAAAVLTTVLARGSLTLAELVDLKAGDVVPCDFAGTVTVLAEQVPIFRGSFGLHRGRSRARPRRGMRAGIALEPPVQIADRQRPATARDERRLLLRARRSAAATAEKGARQAVAAGATLDTTRWPRS